MELGALPDELCRHVALFLPASDVLRLLTVNHRLAVFGRSDLLWRYLLERDAGVKRTSDAESTPEAQKRAYLTCAHMADLSAVQWCPVSSRSQRLEPSPRAGHNMCILGSPSNREVLLTGGFCDDEHIHLLPVSSQAKLWTSVRPTSRAFSVHGASLTALDEQRAVRFGGIRPDGSSVTNQVFVLTLIENEFFRKVAQWEEKMTLGPSAAARFFHSATLVQDRYLVIIGGKTPRGSILQEAILDTKTWTWVDRNISNPMEHMKPPGRHGHSVILDARRNRLVLFGGGSFDYGVDNTDVWQLHMGTNGDFECSLPWNWRQIYRNKNNESDNEMEDADEVLASNFSSVGALVLGRCHIGLRVTVDKVLLAFGSSQPTTNGVLAYDLATDKFHAPVVSGPLPAPRFTAAAVVLENEGWVIAHGGHTGLRVDGMRGDTIVLDLAPAMKREFQALTTGVEGVWSYDAISNADVQRCHRMMFIRRSNAGLE